MTDLVANCPRCKAQSITFDVRGLNPYRKRYSWQNWYEAYSVCKNCKRATLLIVADSETGSNEKILTKGLSGLPDALNNYVEVHGYVSLADFAAESPPEHLDEIIGPVFREGAKCLAVGCNNAAGTMFRLCIDLATRDMVPEGDGGPPAKVRRDLGLRLPWLFENGKLSESLKELSTCVREDGNDGAHAGTLGEEDAKDLLDFTFLLLERIYTEPKRLELAAKRRQERRKPEED